MGMPASRAAHQLDKRRPCTRSRGASGPNTGQPSTMAPGHAKDASMNVATWSAGCWPSASMTRAWLNPAAAAARIP